MSVLTARQRVALEFIRSHGETTPVELADALDTSPHGAVATAASLVRHRFIVRSARGKRTTWSPNP